MKNTEVTSITSTEIQNRGQKIAHMIHSGKTFKYVEKKLEISHATLLRSLEVYYEKSGGKNSPYYKTLMAVQRLNARQAKGDPTKKDSVQPKMAIKPAESKVAQPKISDEDYSKGKEAHLVETGYLLGGGRAFAERFLRGHHGKVFLPCFCMDEMIKLGAVNETARWISNGLPLELLPRGIVELGSTLTVEPLHHPASRRVRALAVIAMELTKRFKRVVVHTNSSEVMRLIQAQNLKEVVVYKLPRISGEQEQRQAVSV